MADTIIQAPASQDSMAGMLIAVILAIAIVVGGLFLFRGMAAPAAPAASEGTTKVDIQIPAPITGGSNSEGANNGETP